MEPLNTIINAFAIGVVGVLLGLQTRGLRSERATSVASSTKRPGAFDASSTRRSVGSVRTSPALRSP